MKRILSVISITTILFGLSSCASTSNVFGDRNSTSTGDCSVYIDNFAGTKTFEYDYGLRGGFALSRGTLTTDYLEITPHLTIDSDNICTPNLNITYRGSNGGFLKTGADKTYNRFIFMDASGNRLEILHNTEKQTESEIDVWSGIATKTINGEYGMVITKSQFDKLMNFFSNAESVTCAAYSTDNKVVTFKSYNKDWHMNVFNALDEAVQKDAPNVVYNETLTNIIVK